MTQLHELLGTLGVTEGSERLLSLAKAFGCVGKISGAGGGDGVVFFCPDENARAALVDALKARDAHALPLTIEEGLRGEPRGEPTLAKWITT